MPRHRRYLNRPIRAASFARICLGRTRTGSHARVAALWRHLRVSGTLNGRTRCEPRGFLVRKQPCRVIGAAGCVPEPRRRGAWESAGGDSAACWIQLLWRYSSVRIQSRGHQRHVRTACLSLPCVAWALTEAPLAHTVSACSSWDRHTTGTPAGVPSPPQSCTRHPSAMFRWTNKARCSALEALPGHCLP